MIHDIAERVAAGERLGRDEACRLLAHANLPELGALAHIVRQRKNPDPTVTYVVGRNINYTNVCTARCRFCAFHRAPGDPDGYRLSPESILRKIEEMVALGGVEVLMQGGLHPDLRIDDFVSLFRGIRERYPDVILHALSPPEIVHIARVSGLDIDETLQRLRAAGIHSIPGGGAEILVDEIRQAVSPAKGTAADWLDVTRIAHRLGLRSTATMVYGMTETLEQRVEHLLRIRELQDETSGFTAFIPWSFSAEGTALGHTLAERPDWRPATGADYLRIVAVARLVLDNIDHLQASWVTQGPKIAQIALRYGVDDFGSTMMEENVVRAAGTAFRMPIEEIERVIRDAGFVPRRRNTRYERLDPA